MNMNIDAFRTGGFTPSFLSRLPKVPTASAISGLIVAALILMTPNPLFEAFIAQTGLPGLIDAATPPLGAKARIVFALIAAAIVTVGAWTALSLLLRGRNVASEGDASWAGQEQDFAIPPRRRADMHPDHPARAPLMAGDDLGLPLDLVNIVPADPDDAFADFGPADAPALGEAGDYGFAEPDDSIDAHDEFRAPFAPEPPVWEEPFEPGPIPAMQNFEDAAAEPQPIDQFEAIEPFAEAAPEPVFTVPLKPRDTAPEPDIAAAPPATPVQSELAELIGRLEAGIAHRRERLAKTAHAEGTAPAAAQSDTDGALREALDALQRLGAKGA